ncbi:MAG: zinc metallopeptidase [Myxococcota bacterium]
MIFAVSLLISFGTQVWVNATTNKWKDNELGQGMTGADVARSLLKARGIEDVSIEEKDGFFTNHYNPDSRVLSLSSDVFSGRSVTAAGLAAHEAGHAIQQLDEYGPTQLRQMAVPVIKVISQIGMVMVVISAAFGLFPIAKIGAVLFGGAVLASLFSLPIELDASTRAREALFSTGLLKEDQIDGTRSVLTAAAVAYVASAVTGILDLLRWASKNASFGDDNERPA